MPDKRSFSICASFLILITLTGCTTIKFNQIENPSPLGTQPQSSKNAPGALQEVVLPLPAPIRGEALKISLTTFSPSPTTPRLEGSIYILQEDPDTTYTLEYFPSLPNFFRNHPDRQTEATPSGEAATGELLTRETTQLGPYPARKRYSYYNSITLTKSAAFTPQSSIVATTCLVELPPELFGGFLYFGLSPAGTGADSCAHVASLRVNRLDAVASPTDQTLPTPAQSSTMYSISAEQALDIVMTQPTGKVLTPALRETTAVSIEDPQPDEKGRWVVKFYESSAEKVTTTNWAYVDATTGAFVCAWTEWGQPNEKCITGEM